MDTMLGVIVGLLGAIAFFGPWWWIEIGSARRDMMRAYADTMRELGPPPSARRAWREARAKANMELIDAATGTTYAERVHVATMNEDR